MNEPKRWLEEEAPGPIRAMLLSARDEEPSRAGMERTLTAVGVSAAVASGAASAAGATAVKTSTAALGWIAVKWSLVGAATAVAAFGGAHMAERAFSSTSRSSPPKAARADAKLHATTPAPIPLAPPSAPVEPSTAELAPERDTAEKVEVVPRAPLSPLPSEQSGSASSPSADTARLLEEVRAVDRARAALSSGNAASALSVLDAYTVAFPHPSFEPEALYLRMQALLATGDPAARTIADRLVRSFPNAPQAARARAVLSGSVR
jgi:hypothetical protein